MRTASLFLLFCSAALAVDSLPSAYWQAPLVRGGEYVLWHDPGAIETLDFRYGIGGEELAPKPPFTFADEDPTGTTPKVKVKDANGRSWVVKFGHESSPDTFCTRLAWALGYYVEPTYYVEDGVIEGVGRLRRTTSELGADGKFRAGRFQLRASEPKFLKYITWSWNDNPFIGTPEFGGLKIVMMLLSNWDNKDARDAEKRGTNTGIYQQGDLLYYFIDDWGGAMGNWGKYFTRSKWDARNYLDQSDNFVSMRGGRLHWGYVGQHSSLLKDGVTLEHVRWLMPRLSRISDEQLRAGLASSGATERETEQYVKALRIRIDALAKLVQ